MITVVAALIEKDNRVLIAKRLTGSAEVLGKWEFPGGKVEKNESEKEALKREIYEEFKVNVEVGDFIDNCIYKYSIRKIDLRLYKAKYISGDFKLIDHSEYKWVKKEDLLSYDLAPADIPLVKSIGGMNE